jgi:hypothetical protein
MKALLVMIILLGVIGASWIFISNGFHSGTRLTVETEPLLPMKAGNLAPPPERGTAEGSGDEHSLPCCSELPELVERIKRVQQKQNAQELWGRGMLKFYGTEEGLKRIAAKNPSLAVRLERRIEKENGSSTLATSQPPSQ